MVWLVAKSKSVTEKYSPSTRPNFHLCNEDFFKLTQTKRHDFENKLKLVEKFDSINIFDFFNFSIYTDPLLFYFSAQPLISAIRFVQHPNITIIAHREADKKIVTAITIKKMTRLHHFWFTRLMLTMKTHNFSDGNTSSPFISSFYPSVSLFFSSLWNSFQPKFRFRCDIKFGEQKNGKKIFYLIRLYVSSQYCWKK